MLGPLDSKGLWSLLIQTAPEVLQFRCSKGEVCICDDYLRMTTLFKKMTTLNTKSLWLPREPSFKVQGYAPPSARNEIFSFFPIWISPGHTIEMFRHLKLSWNCHEFWGKILRKPQDRGQVCGVVALGFFQMPQGEMVFTSDRTPW